MILVSSDIQNTNAGLASSLPRSFPIPIEGREDFFSIDPKSFTIKQLNTYKKEMFRLIHEEKNHLKRMNQHSSTRMKIFNQGIDLARETMKTNVTSSRTRPSPSTFQSIDPKSLTSTQLQLYIKGMTEEIDYEKKLIDQFESESTIRIEAYQSGIQIANEELSRRQGK